MTINRFFGVLRRRFIVVFAVVAVGLALIYSARNMIPNSFGGFAHVVLVADNGSRDPSVGIIDLPSIATSTVVLERVRHDLKLPISLINLKSNVSANVLGRSSIMAIGYRDQSAERAIAVANSVADELSRYYGQISTKSYDVNVERLSKTMAAETQRIHDIDSQMSGVVASNPYVVSDKAIDTITTQIAELDTQRAQAAAQLRADEAIASTTAPGETRSDVARSEILGNDPAYKEIRDVVAKDTAQLAAYRAGYTRDFPGLPGAVAKVTAENQAAEREAARALSDPDAFSPSEATQKAAHEHQLAVIVGDRARLAQVESLIGTQQSSLRDLPSTGMTFKQLRAERDALTTEYTALANRRANALANRAEGASLGSVVVLDRALKADTQLAGNRTRIGLVALLLVIAAAFGAAFLFDSLDPRVRRQEDVEELYGIPVVAHVGAKP